MSRLQSIVLLSLLLMSAAAGQETDAQKYLISVERIWDRALHNAFTDLVDFNGRLYCTFREGAGHVPGRQGTNGTVRIIASDDGQNWRSVALLTEAQVDLRDPKLSVMPDGRLMVLMGGSFYEGEKLGPRHTRVSFSDRTGLRFSAPRPVTIDAGIRTDADWLWRVTWHGGTGYGVVYQSGGEEYKAHLVATRDGLNYKFITTFAINGRPNESTVRFMPDGEMIAWVRREGESRNGWIGRSRAPYTDWSWQEQNVRLGGPNFLATGEGKLIGATRGYLGERTWNTYVARLSVDGSVRQIVALPSGGDTSYAGLVVRGDRLLVSYYSSHEGRSAIYLATLNLPAVMRN